MLNQPRRRRNSMPDDEPSKEGGTSFDWEFVNEDHQPSQGGMASPRITDAADARQFSRGTVGRGNEGEQVGEAGAASRGRLQQKYAGEKPSVPGQPPNSRRPKPTVLPSGGRVGTTQANLVREQLDRALDRWWAVGEMPPLLLLRDGLLLLEAGGSVSESQRTLLLRSALSYHKGIQTALRHQEDAERVALVLAEALVEWAVPLAPQQLPVILAGDEEVRTLLVVELERSRILLSDEPRRRAQLSLDLLQQLATVEGSTAESSVAPITTVMSRRRPFRQILLVLLLLALIGFFLWERRQQMPEGMVAMPAATYALIRADGTAGVESIGSEAFFIDRFEVTNREYRQCVEEGACKWPLRPASATRGEYFTDPAFDGYPVVYVTQSMAAGYCAWQNKRLPSAVEWQVAASVSPNTGQAFRYPWGESFDSQRTNGADAEVGDTLVVGSFRPAGDSPSGASDMAGNVAEWTATLMAGSESKSFAIVKGGSFASEGSALQVGTEIQVEVESALPEVGFRCARTHLLTES